MKTALNLVAATALLASISTIALAQADAGAGAEVETQVDAGAPDETGVDAPPPGVEPEEDPHAAAAGEVEIDYEAIAAGLSTSGATAADIEAVTAEANILIVPLSELQAQAGTSGEGLDDALASLEAGIEDLRTAIGANTELVAKLDAEGYTADDVVGVTTMQDGGLAIVVDDGE